MATLTIRNLDDNVKQELRKRAAERGVSMEQEARDRLADSVEFSESGRGPSRRISGGWRSSRSEPIDFKKLSDDLWDEESLTSFAIDTSAIVAILTGEPEADAFIAALDQAEQHCRECRDAARSLLRGPALWDRAWKRTP